VQRRRIYVRLAVVVLNSLVALELAEYARRGAGGRFNGAAICARGRAPAASGKWIRLRALSVIAGCPTGRRTRMLVGSCRICRGPFVEGGEPGSGPGQRERSPP
jgi:hypothetical protein